MANTKKLIQAAAGAAGGAAALNVEDVFSTYLYEGTGAAQTITNGIDLDGEGGLVWIKSRDNTASHFLNDTERGVNKQLTSNSTDAELTNTARLQNFNANGFSLGDNAGVNASNISYASWTFRKAPKFFDVVTWTGTGSVRTVSHNLGSVPGCIIVKAVSGAALGGVSDWTVYHRGVDATNPEQYRLYLNTTGARVDQTNPWNDTAPTSTEFTVGTDSYLNANGDTYVAYLFAHNDGDGEFGPDGDADIIKCGSYTGGGSSDVSVDLGFEPSFLIAKRTDSSTYGNWYMFDSMRGWTQEDAQYLRPNTSGAEGSVKTDLVGQDSLELNSTGFTMKSQYNPVNQSGATYIYIAIRRGPMAVPEDATDVFDVDFNTTRNTKITTGFAPDLGITKATNSSSSNDHWYFHDRLRGNNPALWSDSTSSEQNYGGAVFDEYMDGWQQGVTNASDTPIDYAFKRAPNFFDVVAYTGNGINGRTVSHNLGVAPEMMWVKRRDSTDNWLVYHSSLGATKHLYLNTTGAALTASWSWNDTSPTDTVFSVSNSSINNGSGGTYIAYLFASLDGVSKVGSYTGNGTSQNIDCGFSSGARFVLIKRSDSSGDWNFYDTERGIVAGNDGRMSLNTTDANDTSSDRIDPYSSGFTVNYIATGTSDSNISGATYIFYAIA